MSLLVGYRALNRNQKWDLGGKVLSTTNTVLVNLDNPRVQRDLARHGTVAPPVQAAGPFEQNDDGVVRAGGTIATRATTLVLDIAAAQYTTAAKVDRATTATTVTLGAADATNPRIDTVVVNTTSDAVTAIAGTATAGASKVNLSGKGTVPASRVVLGYVLVPPTATNITQAAVLDSRP